MEAAAHRPWSSNYCRIIAITGPIFGYRRIRNNTNRSNMLRILAFALFLCSSIISLGQERLFPNKSWVNRKRLREESYTMKWWVTVDSVKREVASVKTQIKILK